MTRQTNYPGKMETSTLKSSPASDLLLIFAIPASHAAPEQQRSQGSTFNDVSQELIENRGLKGEFSQRRCSRPSQGSSAASTREISPRTPLFPALRWFARPTACFPTDSAQSSGGPAAFGRPVRPTSYLSESRAPTSLGSSGGSPEQVWFRKGPAARQADFSPGGLGAPGPGRHRPGMPLSGPGAARAPGPRPPARRSLQWLRRSDLFTITRGFITTRDTYIQ